MSAIEGFLYRQVVNTYHSSTSGRTLILGKDTRDVYTLIQAVCVVIATPNKVIHPVDHVSSVQNLPPKSNGV